MKENWKNIEGYGNYQVSNLGNVRNLNYNRTGETVLLKPYGNGKGYNLVNLYNKSKRKVFTIHKLVATYFVELDSEYNKNNLEVNHEDGNKLNNVYTNLKWITHSNNIKHSYDNNLHKKGIKHHLSKLTEEQVKEIKNLIRLGFSNTNIGKRYNVHYNTIQNIRSGKSWSFV